MRHLNMRGFLLSSAVLAAASGLGGCQMPPPCSIMSDALDADGCPRSTCPANSFCTGTDSKGNNGVCTLGTCGSRPKLADWKLFHTEKPIAPDGARDALRNFAGKAQEVQPWLWDEREVEVVGEDGTIKGRRQNPNPDFTPMGPHSTAVVAYVAGYNAQDFLTLIVKGAGLKKSPLEIECKLSNAQGRDEAWWLCPIDAPRQLDDAHWELTFELPRGRDNVEAYAPRRTYRVDTAPPAMRLYVKPGTGRLFGSKLVLCAQARDSAGIKALTIDTSSIVVSGPTEDSLEAVVWQWTQVQAPANTQCLQTTLPPSLTWPEAKPSGPLRFSARLSATDALGSADSLTGETELQGTPERIVCATEQVDGALDCSASMSHPPALIYGEDTKTGLNTYGLTFGTTAAGVPACPDALHTVNIEECAAQAEAWPEALADTFAYTTGGEDGVAVTVSRLMPQWPAEWTAESQAAYEANWVQYLGRVATEFKYTPEAKVPPLPVDFLQGAPVALPGRGEVVVSVWQGESGLQNKHNSRLILINSKTGTFAYNHERDCLVGAGARFGALSLYTWPERGGSWRLAAPANDGANTRLRMYNPFDINNDTRCIASPAASSLPGPVVAPLAWYANNGKEWAAVVYGAADSPKTFAQWTFAGEAGPWAEDAASVVGTSGSALSGIPTRIDGLAVGRSGDLWVSGAGTGAPAFMRIVWKAATAKIPLTPLSLLVMLLETYSPAAIDSEGNAHVVRSKADQPIGSIDFRYQLMSYSFDAGTGSPDAPYNTSAFIMSYPPVGSPILAAPVPGGPHLIYVVSTTGTIYAYALKDLKLLWTLSTGIELHPNAQPLLVGSTLWLVGKQGQVRGVSVPANGLDATALWPRHLHDNCNSSNSLMKMPECLGNR